MVTQNHFVIPATVLEKFRSRGFPQAATLTADHCTQLKISSICSDFLSSVNGYGDGLNRFMAKMASMAAVLEIQ